MTRLLLLLLIMYPSTVLASDPTGLYYFMAYQALSYLWPFLIPFFYLLKVKPKLKWYVLMLLLPLACLELVDLPFQIYAGLAAWGVVEINDMINKYVFGRHVLAIAFTLLLMPRYRRFLIGKNPK